MQYCRKPYIFILCLITLSTVWFFFCSQFASRGLNSNKIDTESVDRQSVASSAGTVNTTPSINQGKDNSTDGLPSLPHSISKDEILAYQQKLETFNQSNERFNQEIIELGVFDNAQNVLSLIDNSFAIEPIDSDWSKNYHDSIRKSFDEYAALEDNLLEDVTCKSTRCKITVFSDTPETANSINMNFLGVMMEQKYGIEIGSIWSYYRQDDRKQTIYLGRSASISLLDGTIPIVDDNQN